MTALTLHIIWSIAYLIVFILFNLVYIILFNNDEDKIKLYNNNFFINLVLIIFFNKNLSFYKKYLNNKEIEQIEINRLKNWPTINFIHSNINKLEKNNKLINYNINFKQQYNNFKFSNENLNIQNIFNNNLNEKINYAILDLIIKNNYKNLNKFDINDLTVALIIFKNSISSDFIKINTYDLLKFNDYINYSNNCNLEKNFNNTQLVINKNSKNFFYKTKFNNNTYNSYKKFSNLIEISNNYFYLKSFNDFFKLNTEFNESFINDLKQKYLISFSATNIVKYLSDYSVNNSVILYLRKNKIFNKSRYSRNRQTYRTGAYWCLYVNIIAVVAFYFWFYKFTMNFGYLWWLLYALIASFFLPRALKHRFYNPINVYKEFIEGFKWLLNILLNCVKPFYNILLNSTKNVYFNILVRLYQNKIFNYFLENNIESYYVYQSFSWITTTNKFVLSYINNFLYK